MSITVDHNLNSLSSSSGTVTINNTGSIVVAKGTTAQRPGSAQTGMLRFNTDTDGLEVYKSSGWTALGSGGGGSSDEAIAFALAIN